MTIVHPASSRQVDVKRGGTLLAACAAVLCLIPSAAPAQSTDSSTESPEISIQTNENASLAEFLNQLGKSTSPDNTSPDSNLVNRQSVSGQQKSSFFYANPGPWGRLKCFYIYLEPPLEMVNQLPLPHSKVRWSFSLSDAAELPALFEAAGLPEAMKIWLMDPEHRLVGDDEVHLFPALADVEAMTPAMREVIYPVLAKSASNPYHQAPIIITGDSVEEWYRTSKLRPETIAKVSRMSYRKSRVIAFSDFSAILSDAQSETDARLMIKSLIRTRSVMMKLELNQDTDLEAMIDYWTSSLNRRRKDIEPIMQSIVDTGGIESLGITHILPALPRKLLFTYPGPNYTFQGTLPDCHWTTFNFFNYEPHEYLLDERLISQFAMENSEPVSGPFRFGDIVLILQPGTENILHSCVYLADEFVFTKNGRNWISPWVIMSLSDVSRIYSPDTNPGLMVRRLKP